MHKAIRYLAPLAVAATPLLFAPGMAAADGGDSFQGTLNPLNNSQGSGSATITLNGSSADITVNFQGLPAQFMKGPYPHVQHIHIDGAGRCPTPSADKNADGVVNTTEGTPAYGPIGTTLSVKGDTSPKAGTDVKIAPAGSSANYHRTINLDAKSLASVKSGKAVIVVHGLDPATLSKKAQGEKSDLVPSLPLAATSPALCGTLSSMPSGGVATGTGSTSGVEDLGLIGLGGGLVVAGGIAVYAVRRRTAANA